MDAFCIQILLWVYGNESSTNDTIQLMIDLADVAGTNFILPVIEQARRSCGDDCIVRVNKKICKFLNDDEALKMEPVMLTGVLSAMFKSHSSPFNRPAIDLVGLMRHLIIYARRHLCSSSEEYASSAAELTLECILEVSVLNLSRCWP